MGTWLHLYLLEINSVNDEESVAFSSNGSSKRGKKHEIANLSSSLDKHDESLLKVANIAAL